MDEKKKKYYKSLKDKRWIKLRDSILKRDNYRCFVCGSTFDLRVHHKYYFSGTFTPAWEYPDDCLITMCERCHEEHHENNNTVFKPKQTIIRKQKKNNYKKGLLIRLMKDAIKAEKKIKAKYR